MQRLPSQTVGTTTGPILALLGLCTMSACTLALDFSDPIGPSIDSAMVEEQDAAIDAPLTNSMCGDGQTQAPEDCDDKNLTDLDGCSAACTVEAGYGCSGEPSTCTTLAICPAITIVSSGNILVSCMAYFAAGYRASGKYRIDPDGPALHRLALT